MNTLELYIEILNKVRFETLLTTSDLSVTVLEQDSPAYRAVSKINEACCQLSSLLDIMKLENEFNKSR